MKEGGRLVKVTDLKSDNIHLIRECFYDRQVWTKNKLAKRTDLSLAATTNILQYLLKQQEIKLAGEADSTGGRKSKQYILNKDYYHLAALSLKRDDTNFYFILNVIDLLANVLETKKINKKTGTVNDLLEVIEEFVEKDCKIAILALSIPGVCQDGKIDICDFDELVNIDLLSLIRERFNLEVMIENDVNAAGIGFANYYPKAQNIALMYQPKIKYIGCGILINRQLCKGYTNFAGELSYLPFITHHQQDKILQSNPNSLLLKQLVTICCVINPEIIGVCSDFFDVFNASELINYLPQKHWPKIIDVENFDELIYVGLYNLGMKRLKNKTRREDN